MLYLLLYKFKIGKSMRATFQNKESSALMGVNINGVYSLTFGLGCMLVGVAGSLLGTLYLVYPAMGDLAIVKSFIVAILGGLGSIPGAICGGFILGVTESLGAGYISSEYKDVFGFIIVIILLLVRPKGMFGK
jgi:branched-chain amino acid transport system permease protein